MSEPMTKERLAEFKLAVRIGMDISIEAMEELLAEVDRLRDLPTDPGVGISPDMNTAVADVLRCVAVERGRDDIPVEAVMAAQRAYEAGVVAERAACAKLAEAHDVSGHGRELPHKIRDAILARRSP